MTTFVKQTVAEKRQKGAFIQYFGIEKKGWWCLQQRAKSTSQIPNPIFVKLPFYSHMSHDQDGSGKISPLWCNNTHRQEVEWEKRAIGENVGKMFWKVSP